MTSFNISTLSLTTALAATLVAATAATPAHAGDPRIMVPAPSVENISGCWYADRNLYGPYRLRFCLDNYQGGTYRVSGGGHTCRGTVTWRKDWLGLHVALSRSHCGGGMDWTADNLTCSVKHLEVRSDRPRIMVPTPSRGIACTYKPVVWGYPWKSFQANRG